jgi:hypothetical protein
VASETQSLSDHCPTCGVPVKVVGGEEGTFYYAPLVVAPELLSVDPHREELTKAIREIADDLHRGARRFETASDAGDLAVERLRALIGDDE